MVFIKSDHVLAHNFSNSLGYSISASIAYCQNDMSGTTATSRKGSNHIQTQNVAWFPMQGRIQFSHCSTIAWFVLMAGGTCSDKLANSFSHILKIKIVSDPS